MVDYFRSKIFINNVFEKTVPILFNIIEKRLERFSQKNILDENLNIIL